MNLNSSLKNIQRSTDGLVQVISKFHYLILLCLIIAGVGFLIYYINNILNNPLNSSAPTSQVGFNDKFDSQTIQKIDKFKYRDEITALPPPEGRSNPFTE